MNDIDALFNTTWQEDAEIEFVALARAGIPSRFKESDGNPVDCPSVRSYLRALFSENERAILLRTSENFFTLNLFN